MWNPADLGTKGLNRRRHNMLLYLFGFVDEKGERVGELEYQEHKFQEAPKSITKRVKHELPEDSHSFGSASSSKTAKQVLPLAMMQVVGALSQKAEPNALVEFQNLDNHVLLMTNLEWFCFALVVISLMAIVFYMMGNTSESESEEDPESRRRRYLFSSLDEVSDPDEWMALNHRNYSSSSQDTEPEAETDAAGPRVETPLQFGMYHVYLFMQGCFKGLDI